jgi:hypothetical protein
VCAKPLLVSIAKWKGDPRRVQIQVLCRNRNLIMSFESEYIPPWAKELSIDALMDQLTQTGNEANDGNI